MVAVRRKQGRVRARNVRATGGRLMLGLLAFAPSASAQNALTDDQIVHGLVGSWVVASDSTDPKDRQLLDKGLFAVEHFNADGSGDIAIYADNTCTKAVYSQTFTWTISGGISIFRYADGHFSHTTILGVTDSSFTFTIADSAAPISRVRGDCAPHGTAAPTGL
jgi:hypothetical protein